MPPNITKIFLLVFQLLLLLLLSLTKFWGCSPSARMGTPPRGGTQGRQRPPGELNLTAFIHQPFLFLPVGVVFYKASLSSLSISRRWNGCLSHRLQRCFPALHFRAEFWCWWTSGISFWLDTLFLGKALPCEFLSWHLGSLLSTCYFTKQVCPATCTCNPPCDLFGEVCCWFSWGAAGL